METAGSEPRSNNREALRTLGVGARREGECRHDELHLKEALGWSYKKSVGAPANETLKLKVLGKRASRLDPRKVVFVNEYDPDTHRLRVATR